MADATRADKYHAGSIPAGGSQRPTTHGATYDWLRQVKQCPAVGDDCYRVAWHIRRWLTFGTGQCNPSHATLAAGAGVSVRTVQRALATLAALGFLDWTNCTITLAGARYQTSNQYWPTLAGVALPLPPSREPPPVSKINNLDSSASLPIPQRLPPLEAALASLGKTIADSAPDG